MTTWPREILVLPIAMMMGTRGLDAAHLAVHDARWSAPRRHPWRRGGVVIEIDGHRHSAQVLMLLDMSYRELMEIMEGASGLMHEGILRQTPQMVKSGAHIILTHPAPSHDPWTIMAEEDQAGFKSSLVSFDKLLDQHSESTAATAAQREWPAASQALQRLNAACVSCHAMWKTRWSRRGRSRHSRP
ncbi:MAG: hypothetical protein ACQET4_11315 [Pseudomonadota bacterium]